MYSVTSVKRSGIFSLTLTLNPMFRSPWCMLTAFSRKVHDVFVIGLYQSGSGLVLRCAKDVSKSFEMDDRGF